MAEIFWDWLPTMTQTKPSFPCFREQAMAQWDCDEAAYERRVFWHVLPRIALPLAAVIRLFQRDYFARDFALIRELGQTRDATEFHVLIAQFRDDTLREAGWFRRTFRLRVSGRRLLRLRWDLR